MQLDADIEFKVAGLKKPSKNVDKTANQLAGLSLKDDESDAKSDITSTDDKSSVADDSEIYKTLYDKFQALIALEDKFCERITAQKVF